MSNSNLIVFTNHRKAMLDRFGEKLVAHMGQLFYRHDLFHVPVLNMVRAVIDTMMHDRVDYTDEILRDLVEDPEALRQIENTFVLVMIEQKLIQTDFR